MKVKIVAASSGKEIDVVEINESTFTVGNLKQHLYKKYSKFYPSRQSFRLEPRGKAMKDDVSIADVNFSEENTLYFKDLGPQIGWSTVFLTEYAGPLFVYLLFVPRPALIYGAEASLKQRAPVVWIAAACWSFHYMKRILETLFVHRFSKGTMPIQNLFKNSTYYWGFAAFISYFINHPLYTPPAFGDIQVYVGLGGFLVSEYGNFASHCLLRDLRPLGSTERRIPYPSSNPMTSLFDFVSCPNYTYEVAAWIFFTVMTQTFPAGLFTVAGFLQMLQWAQGKHRNYRKEFKDYPKSRKCMIPLLL
ncbi:probable very-long-chain enoyl-CoA reductase art-1 [Xenia sp. Carnegie-2017]|uniref:probable very-long-chain enoyl-CoA reductase art-1 n=1 Tax=Xenia sp. Carnegie-2017 TaxID=2897299 RepID=UPI001F044599|nr:probable very-long-chain enoyl-CoA reductase art-1 [Xenia sp. Carnegie-2017]